MSNVINIIPKEGPATTSATNPPIDYMRSDKPFVVTRFIVECSNKLNASVLTGATAVALFHRYSQTCPDPEYDPYLMATACIYVAGKMEDGDHLRLRDIINVIHSTLHRNDELLELDSQYYATREAIVQAELFLLRMVNFQTRFTHPHKYLLHYLKSLKDWLSEEVWDKYPIARTSWALLQDFYHDPTALTIDGSLVSLACIQLALQTYGIAVPFASDSDKRPWHTVFNETATKDALWDIMARIMEVYTTDASQIEPLIIHQRISIKIK